jgi:hypothetical protein
VKLTINIDIDTNDLAHLTDERVATLWHVAQANPAPIDDRAAGEVADAVGREIIRRWLNQVHPELWHHQGAHHFWSILQKHGKWLPVAGDENNREWTPDTQLRAAIQEVAA